MHHYLFSQHGVYERNILHIHVSILWIVSYQLVAAEIDIQMVYPNSLFEFIKWENAYILRYMEDKLSIFSLGNEGNLNVTVSPFQTKPL